ncbi:MAG: hypothetical protein R3282_01235, partial [Rhodothermales bacterium]|nr:hypothetical protein [Rhodothermales bacterium]
MPGAFRTTLRAASVSAALIIVGPPLDAFSQADPGTSRSSEPALSGEPSYRVSTGMERDISRYRWVGSVALEDRYGGWRLSLSNRFVSDAFILFNDNLSFRDENRLAFTADAPRRGSLAATVRGNLGWYSLSRVLNASTLVGFRYHVSRDLSVEPRLGASVDSRPGAPATTGRVPLRTDAGPAVGAEIRFNNRPDEPWRLTAAGAGTWKSIAPRRSTDLQLQGRATRRTEDLNFSTTIYASSVRRDSYQAVSFLNRSEQGATSESVEATRSDTLLISGNLRTAVAANLNLSTAVRLGTNSRTVRTFRAPDEALFFDTDFTRQSVDIEVDLNYRRPRLDATVGLKGGVENEERLLANREDLSPAQASQKTNLLRQADFDQGFLEIHAKSIVSPLRFLAVSVDGAASILRHDTPAINPDDRDEQFLTGRLGIRVRFSRHLTTDLSFFASRYETVYLKAERSAENNVQRALRFRPGIVWTPSGKTTIRLTSEVRATYTVDDF